MQTNGLVCGKVAVVTGGAAGIGEAICKVFAHHGANVVVNGYPGDPIDAVVAEITEAGGTAVGHSADVATAAGADGLVQTAIDRFGKLDVLIANAGLFPEQAELSEFPLRRFEELLHSNILGTYLPARAALAELRKTKGVILAASSEAAFKGIPQSVSYASTTGWTVSFVRSLAVEQAKYGVRVNAVAPGPIDTEMTRPTKGEMTFKTALMAVTAVPLGRRGTPEEVANVYLFLASDLASYVTGAVYTVDGGATVASGLPGLEARRDVKRAPRSTVSLEHQYEGRGTLS